MARVVALMSHFLDIEITTCINSNGRDFLLLFLDELVNLAHVPGCEVFNPISVALKLILRQASSLFDLSERLQTQRRIEKKLDNSFSCAHFCYRRRVFVA